MREGQIIVTGASRGTGAAIAAELDCRSFAIAALSRSGESSVGRGYRCDMSDEASFADAIGAVAAQGAIIGLINNTGAHTAKPSAELSEEAEFETAMRLNATSLLVGAREAYPHLVKAGGGLIVKIGSFSDKLGVTANLAYCTCKAAVDAIARCVAVEWAKDNIRVMNVAPGYIETALNREFLANGKVRDRLARRIPVGRPGQTDQVGRFVGSLLPEDIGFLTGETVCLDGGQGMSPR